VREKELSAGLPKNGEDSCRKTMGKFYETGMNEVTLRDGRLNEVKMHEVRMHDVKMYDVKKMYDVNMT
jgi:hypothetical protein